MMMKIVPTILSSSIVVRLILHPNRYHAASSFVILPSSKHQKNEPFRSIIKRNYNTPRPSIRTEIFATELEFFDLHPEKLPFKECWAAETPPDEESRHQLDQQLLQKLCSPAPQSHFILQRAINRCNDHPSLLDTLKECSYLLKPEFHFAISKDESSLDWEAVDATNDDTLHEYALVEHCNSKVSTLDLAHRALHLATVSSEQQTLLDLDSLHNLTNLAKKRLELTLGTDIRGRSSADAAFSFAMAGVDDNGLYQALATVGLYELERTGRRQSFQSKYILQIIEKFAAAGIRGDVINQLHRVASDVLELKGNYHADVVETLRRAPETFDLHATRPLLWLWRFSSKQRKVKVKIPDKIHEVAIRPTQPTHSQSKQWIQELQDPALPLVADIGCGMGVSLLGLASLSEMEARKFSTKTSGLDPDLFTGRANFVGCDLSALTGRYAQGIGKRWGINNSLHFCNKPAIDFVKDLEDYPGSIPLILVQFPTPFRFSNQDEVGNTQLPTGLTDGFMVSPELLKRIHRILKQSGGCLLFQSNVEDVAVTVKKVALEMGFIALEMSYPVTEGSSNVQSADTARIPQRTQQWILTGGERAQGSSWSKESLLPRRGATETEISCLVAGTPVHRFVLKAT